MLVEIGGTVGDIESLPFLEAIRQFRQDVGRENTLYIHLTLVPYIASAGELKTKPTQHSVRDLRSIGIQPDILLCRTDRLLAARPQAEDRAVLRRQRRSGDHRPRRRRPSTKCRWCCSAEGLDTRASSSCSACRSPKRAWRPWEELVERIKQPDDELTIHVVGKYTGYEDSYKSLNEALYHGGFANRLRINIQWVESEALEQEGGLRLLEGAHGILVPGGFGSRGTRGMMKAAEYARRSKMPYLRHLLRLPVGDRRVRAQRLHARGRRLDRSRRGRAAQVIYKLRDLLGVDDLGGTMRLGRYECELAPGSLARADLRRRPDLTSGTAIASSSTACTSRALREKGMRISGRSPDGKFVEIAELPGHPWFVAVQFHPEFQSRPLKPHPLFASFVEAAQRAEARRDGRRSDAGSRCA